MNILRFLGLSRCYHCNRIVWPWQEFYGQISTTLIPDGRPHRLYAKYVTHAGRCTEEDIKRMEDEKKKKPSSERAGKCDNSYLVFVGILFCIWGISACIFTYTLILGHPPFIGWGVFIALFIPTIIFYFERLDNELMNRKGRI